MEVAHPIITHQYGAAFLATADYLVSFCQTLSDQRDCQFSRSEIGHIFVGVFFQRYLMFHWYAKHLLAQTFVLPHCSDIVCRK